MHFLTASIYSTNAHLSYVHNLKASLGVTGV